MTKQRTPAQAQKAIDAATDLVVEQGDIIQQDKLWDAAAAALDGRPSHFDL